jgi:hypothetical protein
MENIQHLNLEFLSIDEQEEIDGGWAHFLAIGAGAAAALAIYQLGKEVGGFIYYATH